MCVYVYVVCVCVGDYRREFCKCVYIYECNAPSHHPSPPHTHSDTPTTTTTTGPRPPPPPPTHSGGAATTSPPAAAPPTYAPSPSGRAWWPKSRPSTAGSPPPNPPQLRGGKPPSAASAPWCCNAWRAPRGARRSSPPRPCARWSRQEVAHAIDDVVFFYLGCHVCVPTYYLGPTRPLSCTVTSYLI